MSIKKSIALTEKARKKKVINDIILKYSKLDKSKTGQEEYKKEIENLSLRELNTLNGNVMLNKNELDLGSKLRRKNKQKSLLISFMHINGNMSYFVISKYGRIFTLNGKSYVINSEDIFYNNTYQMNSLLYHENVVLPINITSTSSKDFNINVDPQNLKAVIRMEYVELLTKVGKVKDQIKLILLIAGIGAGASIITLLLTLKTSGVIN